MRILTTGIRELNKNIFKSCGKEPELNKPSPGSCLYGSTLIKKDGCWYSDWMRFTGLDYTDKFFNYGISYTLNKSVKISDLNNLEDYLNLMKYYKYTNLYKNQIDFYNLSKDFDAFHLSEDAFWSLRFPFLNDTYYTLKENNYDNMYSYDAETWIIFNLDCINEGSIFNHQALKLPNINF